MQQTEDQGIPTEQDPEADPGSGDAVEETELAPETDDGEESAEPSPKNDEAHD